MSVESPIRPRSLFDRADPASTYTRVLSALLIPFLVVAFVLLYLLPENTETHFAWTIEPPLTAMFLASAYLGGVWFFVAGTRRSGWSLIGRGMPAVLVFASLLLIATLMHLNRFHSGHISFITWLVLYLTTPLLVTLAMVVQRHAITGAARNTGATIRTGARSDPLPSAREYRIPVVVRLVLAVIGVASMASGIALFLNVGALMTLWPWTLTPLTAQVVGAALTLPGVVNLALLIDARWSASRTIFQAQIVSLVAIVGALVLRRDDLQQTPSSMVFTVGIVVSLIAYVLFYVDCDRRRR